MTVQRCRFGSDKINSSIHRSKSGLVMAVCEASLSGSCQCGRAAAWCGLARGISSNHGVCDLAPNRELPQFDGFLRHIRVQYDVCFAQTSLELFALHNYPSEDS